MKRNILDNLAIKFGTDKFSSHYYTPHYHHHFKGWRNKKLNLFEIGVGGYGDPYRGGESLRMWKEYFRNAMVYALDINEKIGLEEDRIRIFQGSQTDEELLGRISREAGGFDIIIDDGSHVNNHVITSFKILFPLLRQGGIYVVEDTQTSYWPYEGYGGDSDDLLNPATSMNFFKGLTDCLNHAELIRPGYKTTYFDKNIISMHFYHNLVFIYKGANDEPSNMIRNNSIEHLIARPREALELTGEPQ